MFDRGIQLVSQPGRVDNDTATNWERDCIDLMIQHKSFEIVPEASVIPRSNNSFHVRNLSRMDLTKENT